MGDLAGPRAHRRRLSDAIAHTLLRRSGEAVSVIGAGGDIRYASPNWASVLGLEPTEAIGRAPTDLLPAEEGARVDRAVKAHLAAGRRSFTIETRGGLRGDRIWCHRCEARFDDPAVRGLLVLTRDVTEERRAATEASDRREADRLVLDILRDRAVLDRAEIGHWVLSALERIGCAAGADRATVVVFDPWVRTIFTMRTWTAPGVEPGPQPGELMFVGFDPDRLEAWCRSGQTITSNHSVVRAEQFDRTALHRAWHSASILAHPLVTSRGPGALVIESVAAERSWPGWSAIALRQLAEPLAAAVDEDLRHAEDRRAREADDLLAALAQRLLAHVDPDIERVLDHFAGASLEFLGAVEVVLALEPVVGAGLRYRTAGGTDAPPCAAEPGSLDGELAALADVAGSDSAVFDSDHPASAPSSALFGQLRDLVRVMAAPLVARGRIIGFLAAGAEASRRWTEQDRRFLRAAADTIAGALLRAEAEDRLRAQVVTDALTGLGNRQALVERLGALSARSAARPAVVFIDLDGFKAINDRHGHAVGDELLRRTARRLVAAVGRDDFVARLGGDEFVVVADHVRGHDDAEALGRRIARFLRGLEMPEISLAGLRASIGVAVGGPASAEAWLHHADHAMYEAKRCRDTDVVVRVVAPGRGPTPPPGDDQP
jgi:diguanylate cyclase (GGDEF)-like protein/PAS domain S-box-containing protein